MTAIISGLFPMLFYSIPIFGVVGGIIAYLLIYSIAWDGGVQPVRLILVGVALNLVFTGLTQAIASFSGGGVNLTETQSIVNGNITQKTWEDVRLLAIYTLVRLIFAIAVSRKCNCATQNPSHADGCA